MRIILIAVVVDLLLNSAPVLARRAAVEVVEPSGGTNATARGDWRQWISYAFRPPSREEVEVGLEARWKQLEEDVSHQKSRLAQHLEEVNRNAQETITEIEVNMDNTKKQIKKRIEADIFKQKQGWRRFRKSARAQAGIVVGGAMTFAGGALSQTSPSIQAAQLSWDVLDKYNITRGIHDPWIKDAAAGLLAVSLVATASGNSNENATLQQRTIPILTITLSIFQSVGIILDKYEGGVSPETRIAVEAVATVLGTAVLSLLPLPLSIVAASIAGASLLFQSVVAEVVSNWFWLMERGAQSFERMDRKERRKIEKTIRTQTYHILEQKLLYPVRGAFEEIHAALHNQTLAEPTLQDKVHKAINDSHKVKLVWSFAAAGMVFQILWRTKPVEHVLSSVHSWWVDLTTSKPKAIKKRRAG